MLLQASRVQDSYRRGINSFETVVLSSEAFFLSAMENLIFDNTACCKH